MAVRIVLDNPPEFYTNLDFVSGRVVLNLGRPETVGAVVVKLEGESRTALAPPLEDHDHHRRGTLPGSPGPLVSENHKLLYKVQQVYPDERAAAASSSLSLGPSPTTLNPGQHHFRFRFKVPLNNICHDPKAMSALVGVGSGGGSGSYDGEGSSPSAAMGPGGGFLGLGLGGFRTMDGTRQLFLRHVKATLPPSLTGFPHEAEIRYYIKVTVQRPGFFKENWRYQLGFKFLPIEPPRPPPTHQEAFARRPFVFRTPIQQQQQQHQHQHQHNQQPSTISKKSSLFGLSSSSKTNHTSDPATQQPQPQPQPPLQQLPPPTIEMAARVPHPSIISCNEPLPLRLLARRLSGPYAGTVRLVGLEIALVGHTHVRVQDLHREEHTRWIVVSAGNLSVELFPARRRDGESGGVASSSSSNGESSQSRNTSDNINTGKAGDNTPAATANGDGKGAGTAAEQQQDNNNTNNNDAEEEFEIPAEGLWAHLPLPNTVAPSFRTCNLERRYEIEVKLSLSWDGGSSSSSTSSSSSGGGVWGWMKGSSGGEKPPPPQIIHLPLTLSRVEVFSGIRPPRPPGHPLHHPHPPHYQQQQQPQQQQQHQPPQEPPYDDLPPSYDEAMAADITAPPVQARPAYSGVTAENDPSTLPGGGAEKS